MQSDRDAERIRALGAPESRVRRTGNIKFDQWTEQADHEPASVAAKILAEHEELLVAGSTHPGEEEALLACYKSLHREFPRLVLLMAPRHIDRAAQVEATAAAMGFEVVRRSRLEDRTSPWEADKRKPRVVILDTRGELAAIYRHAVLAFVGGTLVPVGGHNLLEPAAWGKPVLFGPHTDHCFEVAELLEQAQGGRRVSDGRSLAEEMTRLLRDRSALQRMGAAARQALLANRGALERSVEAIVQVLHGSNPKTERASGAQPLLRTEELRP
jgi:3-deoxy-D-manno-octulosonic-acid transferase